MTQIQAPGLGRFDMCGGRCDYIDLVHSFNDTRRRYWSGAAGTIWDGGTKNSTTRNNCGQHVEPYLDCNVAVYHYNHATGMLEQWERDVESGFDLVMRWETILDDWWQRYINLAIAQLDFHRFSLYTFQSTGGNFFLYAPQRGSFSLGGELNYEERFGRVESFNVSTGDSNWRAFASRPVDPNDDTSEIVGIDPWDALPGEERALVIERGAFSDGNGLIGSQATASLYSSTDTAPTNMPLLTPYLRPATPCSATRHFQYNGSLEDPSRVSFARYQGIYGFGDTPGGAEYPGPEEMKTSHTGFLDACDHEYLGLTNQELGIPNFMRAFTSVYCDYVYHIAGSLVSSSIPDNAWFRRYDPVNDTSEKFALHTEALPYRDWHHVVNDTHPLTKHPERNGRVPADDCVYRCGDGGPADLPDEPPCCLNAGDIPALVVDLVREHIDSDCDDSISNPNDDFSCLNAVVTGDGKWCVKFSASAALTDGCVDDRIVSLTLQGYGMSGGPPAAIQPCWGVEALDEDDDFFYSEGVWRVKPQAACFFWIAEARTLKGCLARVISSPGDISDTSIAGCPG